MCSFSSFRALLRAPGGWLVLAAAAVSSFSFRALLRAARGWLMLAAAAAAAAAAAVCVRSSTTLQFWHLRRPVSFDYYYCCCCCISWPLLFLMALRTLFSAAFYYEKPYHSVCSSFWIGQTHFDLPQQQRTLATWGSGCLVGPAGR